MRKLRTAREGRLARRKLFSGEGLLGSLLGTVGSDSAADSSESKTPLETQSKISKSSELNAAADEEDAES